MIWHKAQIKMNSKVAGNVENSRFFLMPKFCRIAFCTMSMPESRERKAKRVPEGRRKPGIRPGFGQSANIHKQAREISSDLMRVEKEAIEAAAKMSETEGSVQQ